MGDNAIKPKAKVWHYVNDKGVDVIREWASDVPKRQRVKLQQKIDALIKDGSELSPQLLSDSKQPGIKKIKVQGNPKLRPLLCKVPTEEGEIEEWVLLVGAYEVNWDLVPEDAYIDAAIRKKEVLDGIARKTIHTSIIR